ncbi:hypothetical protein ACIHFB_24620 [Streptomyces sp. NPDC051963]|uniref:hypothetical protein n=1 Tax=Streptomyces sp. NPDC051963 TaxID=3365678 RepID=UPI0037D3F200
MPTDAKATHGYGVQVDAHQGSLRLYRIDGNVTLGTYATTIKADTVYRLRVEAGTHAVQQDDGVAAGFRRAS